MKSVSGMPITRKKLKKNNSLFNKIFTKSKNELLCMHLGTNEETRYNKALRCNDTRLRELFEIAKQKSQNDLETEKGTMKSATDQENENLLPKLQSRARKTSVADQSCTSGGQCKDITGCCVM